MLQVTGQDLRSLMKDRLFKPLGMTRTGKPHVITRTCTFHFRALARKAPPPRGM